MMVKGSRQKCTGHSEGWEVVPRRAAAGGTRSTTDSPDKC